MNDTVEAKPESLGGLAQQLIDLAMSLRETLDDSRVDMLIPENAFGDTDGATPLSETYARLFEDAGFAVEDVADVLETDVDLIYRIAFAYQETDKDGSDRIAANGSSGELWLRIR